MTALLRLLMFCLAATLAVPSVAAAQSGGDGTEAATGDAATGDAAADDALADILNRQEAAPDDATDAVPSAQDAAESLEDILARQRGEGTRRTPRDFHSARGNAADLGAQLGALGGPSDSEFWDALRFGTAEVSVSAGGDVARVIMQDRGMWWHTYRTEIIKPWGGYLLLGTLGLLVLFFLVRGRIRISQGRAGVTILRFRAIERFAHWLLAGSFIILGLTGLISLYARIFLLPQPAGALNTEAEIMARQADGALVETILQATKWLHNNVAWAFMLAIVMIFVLWVVHNLPSRHDLVWFAKGGGLIGSAHPPAKKFNAGQKIIFWSVILLGGSISASGLSLLFPFELPMFAKTFAVLNDIGVSGWLGSEPYPEALTPHEEMQFAQLWHAIVSFVLMAIVIAHIYIGSVGMEGAYDAMGSGEVDLNWAKDHHSLWVEEVQAKEAAAPGAPATPAE